tara:strand:- start:341 stop:553 length:213 start_codon:yes stop_codon:yes gene_type:complete
MDKINMMKSFLILGDLMNNDKTTIEEQVKYKQQIVFATMKSCIPGWQPPSDWDQLSDETKLKRLSKMQKV